MVGVALGRVKASESQAPRSPSSASQARLRARFATGSTFTSRRCALLTRRVDVLFVSFLLIVLASFEGGACGRGGGRLVAQDLPESRVEELAPLTSIEFTGRDWISTETLLGRSGLALDEPVTRARIDEAVARLRNDEWLEQVGDPEVTSAPDGTRVAIPVTPRRVVRDLEIESDVREIETAVREKLLLRPGRPFVEASLDEDRDRLLDWLHDEGYLFAGVEASVEELPQGGVALTWTVRSGARVRLGSVTFRGNESFSDRELRAVSGLRPVRLFGALEAGFYRPGDIEEAVQALERHYARLGWLDARVAPEAIRISADKTRLEVDIAIDEGPRYVLAGYEIIGSEVFPDRLLREVANLEVGGFYRAEAIEAAARRLLEWYDTRSDLRPRLDLATERGLGQTARVRFLIDEREAPRIRRVDVIGNEVTRDRVVRSFLVFDPGDLYRASDIEESASRLQASQLFESAAFTRVDTGVPGLLDIEVEVEERDRYGWLEVGGGAAAGAGEVAYISIESLNFDLFRLPRAWNDWSGAFTGGGQRLSVQLIPGSRESEYRFLFVEPYFFSSRQSLSVLGASSAFRREGYDETRWHGSLELRRYFDDDHHASVALGWNVADVLVDDLDPGLPFDVVAAFGHTFLSHPRLSARWDDLEVHPLAGPSGSRVDLSFDIGGDPTGSDVDFARATVRADLFVPLFDDVVEWRHNLYFGLVGGWSRGLDTRTLPITERFFVGGPHDFRGFRYRSIGPRLGDTPLGGQALIDGTIEYDFPLFFEEVRAVLLFDWGTLEPSFEDIDLGRFRTAIGGGLRLRVPVPFVRGRVPVNLYWTEALTSEPGDDETLFSFTLGFGI